MNKFLSWSDDELERLAEAFEICYSEGVGPETEIDIELLAEMDTRELETPWWAEILKGR